MLHWRMLWRLRWWTLAERVDDDDDRGGGLGGCERNALWRIGRVVAGWRAVSWREVMGDDESEERL